MYIYVCMYIYTCKYFQIKINKCICLCTPQTHGTAVST